MREDILYLLELDSVKATAKQYGDHLKKAAVAGAKAGTKAALMGLGHVALASVGAGGLVKHVDSGVKKLAGHLKYDGKGSGEANRKIADLHDKFANFTPPVVAHKYKAEIVIRLVPPSQFTDLIVSKKTIEHSGGISASSRTEAEEKLKTFYEDKFKALNKKVEEQVKDANKPTDQKKELRFMYFARVGSLEEDKVRKWAVTYYDKDIKEGVKYITSDKNKDSVISAFRNQYKKQGFTVIPEAVYIMEGKMSKISELNGLCEELEGLRKPNNISTTKKKKKMSEVLVADDLGNRVTIQTAPGVNSSLPRLEVPELAPNDVMDIAMESICDLYEGTALYIKLLYKGLGSKSPVGERLVSPEAYAELSSLLDHLVLTPVLDFTKTKELVDLINKRFRFDLSDLPTQVKALQKMRADFVLGSKLMPVYDSLELFFEYLLFFIRDMQSDVEYDLSDLPTDLFTYINQPLMDKDSSLTYMSDLQAYVE